MDNQLDQQSNNQLNQDDNQLDQQSNNQLNQDDNQLNQQSDNQLKQDDNQLDQKSDNQLDKQDDNQLNQDDNQINKRLFCLCKQPYDPKRFMVKCDTCHDLYHCDCLKIDEDQIKKMPSFVCNHCRETLELDDDEELNLEIEYDFEDNDKLDYNAEFLDNLSTKSNNESSNYESSNYESSNYESSNYESSNYESSNYESTSCKSSNDKLLNKPSIDIGSNNLINSQLNTQSTDLETSITTKSTSSSENVSIGEFSNVSTFNSQIIDIHKDEPMNLHLINLDIEEDTEPMFKTKFSQDNYNCICFPNSNVNSSKISKDKKSSNLSNVDTNLTNTQIESSSSSFDTQITSSISSITSSISSFNTQVTSSSSINSDNSTESSSNSDVISTSVTYSSPNSQLTKRELTIDNYLDDKIKKTILIRLEILMKTLHGKGLFFKDKLMIVKKCWENSKFEGKIRMNLKENNGIVYQRLSHMKRVSLLFMACKIYILVLDNKVTTRRNIYYEHKDLFSVTTCYNLIEMICSFVNLSRRELNIISTGKGLVAGNLIIEFENNNKINGADYRKGFLIPDSLIFTRNILTNANYVLVVEKDAIFNKLIDNNYHLNNNIIIITSKGYPDVYTRELVNLLSEKFSLKLFGIFDCDPFGIDIYCCFKFGSFNLIHHSKQITSPKMIWLGIYPTEILSLRLRYENFSEADEKRMKSLLKRVYLKNNLFLSNEIFTLNEIKIKSGLQDLNDSIFGFVKEKVYNVCSSLEVY